MKWSQCNCCDLWNALSIDANCYGVLKTDYVFLLLITRGNLNKVVAVSGGMGDIGKQWHRSQRDDSNNSDDPDRLHQGNKTCRRCPILIGKATLSTLFTKPNATNYDNIVYLCLFVPAYDTSAWTWHICTTDHSPPNIRITFYRRPQRPWEKAKLNEKNGHVFSATHSSGADGISDELSDDSWELKCCTRTWWFFMEPHWVQRRKEP